MTHEEILSKYGMDEHMQPVVDVTPDAPTTDDATPPVSSFNLKYQYNKAEYEVTDEDEAKTLVQLGRYYKEHEEQFKAASNDEAIKLVNHIATKLNLPKEEVIKTMYNDIETQLVTKRKEQYESEVPDEVLKQIIKQEDEIDRLKKSQQDLDKQLLIDKEIKEFKTMFPTVDVDALPQEVTTYVSNGYSLTAAYTQYAKDAELNALKTKLAELEANSKNQSTAPPAIGATSTIKDQDILSDDYRKNVLPKLTTEQKKEWLAKAYSSLK